jgi:Co/Zn/Cd efflux system component
LLTYTFVYAHSFFILQHVFADTLRSIAVIVAATVAELADGVTSEEADATAAVVVSVLILLSLLPLLSGLISTFGELRAINAEERDERIGQERQSPNRSIIT